MPLDLAPQPPVICRDVSFLSGQHKLQGKLLRPLADPKAIIVLHGATGVPARFYLSFATWLAEAKGLACLIYDYRDFASSARRHPRQSKAKMADWGVHDQQAARDFATGLFPDLPLWIIGHSLGGLCLPFQRALDQIDRVIIVASGVVTVRDHPWPYQAMARLFWYGPGPLATALSGYMPAKALKIGENLPAGVYWQWRRWCTRRDFFAREFGSALPYPDWAAIKAPSKFVAVADDVMTPPATVWRLMQHFPNAPKTQLTLRPGDFGLPSLGHIGVFAEQSRGAWDEIIA